MYIKHMKVHLLNLTQKDCNTLCLGNMHVFKVIDQNLDHFCN